jgi:lipopolysaccharide transport system ATP-binding protein
MSANAVEIESLSKRYRIGARESAGRDLRDTLGDAMRAPWRRLQSRQGSIGAEETLWALRDIDAAIQPGEVVGIIGQNGAGKSTLLKILSRITRPTTGRVRLRGRVGSLLEVGTGFHPELTGRENVYLNGSILGMHHRETRSQFDAILQFAGLERFIDTPVKRYSTGMYVRLAFAVAAHLNPEIMLVDEVLAVGDAAFQQKCLGRMRDVALGGRTVIFVSHDMHSIAALCTRGIVLQNGQIDYQGDPRTAIDRYLSSLTVDSPNACDIDRRPGSGEYRYTRAAPRQPYYGGADLKEIEFRIERRHGRLGKMFLQAEITDSLGAMIAVCDSRLVAPWLPDAEVLEGTFRFTSPWLKPGLYRINLYVKTLASTADRFDNACTLNISPVLPYPNIANDGIDYTFVLADFGWSPRIASPLSDRHDENA